MNITIDTSELSSDGAKFITNRKHEEVLNALEIGIMVTNKVQTNSDMDFVKNQIDNLIASTTNTFNGLDAKYSDIIKAVAEKNFDPAHPTSYSKRFGDFLNVQAGSMKETINLQLQSVKEQLAMVAEHTSEKDSSSLGKVKASVIEIQRFIEAQFKGDNTDSYAYQLKQKTNEMFSSLDTNIKTIIEEKLRAEFSVALKPIMDEFVVIREAISKEEGKAEIMELTSAKGFVFEDELFRKLQSVAQPFGDAVEETGDAKEITGSKKGDFLYHFAELNANIIIEAKDKEVRQKESLTYMKTALASRGCEFGILVAKSGDQLQKQIGRWNFYDNVVICCADDIEMSIRFARFLIQFRKVKTDGINVGEIKSKLAKCIEEIKKFQTVRTNLTNIKQAVDTGVEKIRTDIDGIQSTIKHIFEELETLIDN
jgi:hypothetical protein